ncbi:MAG: EamA family transporter [Gammaproteobacteria bacterium]
MSTSHEPIAHSRLALVVAFAIVYVVWGSTYLAIRFAIETLPPFLMAAVRFLAAGTVLYAWARIGAGAERPGRAQWKAAAVVGLLLLLGGNGLVVWSELRIPSGVAALLGGTTPLWMVLIDWLRRGGARPTGQVVLGLLCGFAGLVWLVGPDSLAGGGRIDLLGAAAVVLAGIAWAAGSIYQRHAPMPRSPSLSTAMQMLTGGVGLFVVGSALGEWHDVDVAAVSLRSLFGFLYLVVFGSLIAFNAYVWLLRASTPARVSTHTYVNPIVAVFLGWAVADEPLTPRMLVAVAVIVGGVALITLAPKR